MASCMHVFLMSSVAIQTILLIFLAAVAMNSGLICCGNTDLLLLCHKSEREALLKFKEDVTDPSNLLASWTGEGDCCRSWTGVVCNNATGHVEELSLNRFGYNVSKLGGKINPCLVNLKNLRYLDLGTNNFSGRIPPELGNISGLQHLRIGYYWDSTLYVESLQWLSGLSLLRHLHLGHVNLSRAVDWLRVTSMLHSLVELDLYGCQLPRFPSSMPAATVNFTTTTTKLVKLDLSGNQLDYFPFLGNMTSLQILDLSDNSFNSSIPDWLYSLSSLVDLRISSSSLHGLPSSLPAATINFTTSKLVNLDLSRNQLDYFPSLGNMTSLQHLDLSYNSFNSSIPDWLYSLSNLVELRIYNSSLHGPISVSIARLSSLTSLYLSDNELNGTLPDSFGQVTSLESFYIDGNSLQGVVSEVHFANLTRLKSFWANGNQLTLRVKPDWVPPFQIESYLGLRSCQLGPHFPTWLRSQKHLGGDMDMSNAGISDAIPSWFWNLTSQVDYLDLSLNHIGGEIEYIPSTVIDEISNGGDFEPVPRGLAIDLSFNNLTGPLPGISSHVTELYLSHNSFSGPLSSLLCYRMEEVKMLRFLDLEGNTLSGEIPNCWMNWPHLEFVHLGNNNLTGRVPSSMGFLSLLQSLNLRDNHLFGGFPLSLRNCTEMFILDLGHNQFSGMIPAWIGESLSYLNILILQSNKFHGHIPIELCQLNSLRIVAFANNKINGTIPRCFSNSSAMGMIEKGQFRDMYALYYPRINMDNAILVTRGREDEYSTNLYLVTLINLSGNNLSGEIPKEVTDLVGLTYLNLSRNRLTGRIPGDMGSMTSLESIDFSANQLSGEIPASMAGLTFLSHLNLSYNNLTGKIPSSTQLQSFNSSSFVGNNLCGPPLAQSCGVIPPSAVENNGEDKGSDDKAQVDWFYVTMALGFVVGFWGIVGPVFFNKSWRFSYFQFIESLWFRFWGVITKCYN